MNPSISPERLWQAVCGELSVSISPASFSSWINPCFISNINEIDTERLLIELACPSAFHQHTIDERYYGQIKKFLEHQTQKRCELALVIKQKPVTTASKAPEIGLFAPQPQQTFNWQEAMTHSGLNPRFSFDNFVVGGSNNLAYAAAKAVVDSPGNKHNPLFIWGGVGVGKTHLMHAIGRALLEKGLEKITVVTSEQFTNEFIATLRSKTVDSFKKKFRNVDALLIDDIQFIATKESTQEEFFHTFNELYAKQKQIIMTSDRRPQDIQQVEQRLISRFLGGLTVDIGLPDYEMRFAMLKQKADEYQILTGDGALDLIATHVQTNSRELEGTFMRLVSLAQLQNRILDRTLVEQELKVKSKVHEKHLRPQEVISIIAKEFEFRNKDLVGKSRKAELVRARHIAMYILREEMGMQLERVATLMGGRDHTTVMHAVEKMKREFGINQETREQIMHIKQNLYQ